MKILELSDPSFGKCFTRISQALHKHLKNVEWVSDNPDLVTIQALGEPQARWLEERDISNVVVFQMNFQTSGVALERWVEIWKRAALVVSFIDLPQFAPGVEFNFYRTALGAEPDEFPINLTIPRETTLFTTGHIASTECIDAQFEACKLTNRVLVHTGENFNWDTRWYRFLPYMDQPTFANRLARTQYVGGMRLIEGFEMMLVEGAMTGARPITLELPVYDFYKGLALYVRPDAVLMDLVRIFQNDYSPMTRDEVFDVRDRFSWATIIGKLEEEIKHA
jgi:hypothetical protein